MIPQKVRDKILEELHRAHSGMATMKAVARSHVWWPKLDSDIAQLMKSCVSCQETSCGTFATKLTLTPSGQKLLK